MNQLKPYPAYKDSGIPWLGNVPQHWDIKRNKLFMREVNERSEDGSEELLTVSQYTGITKRRDRLSDNGELLTNALSLEGYKKVTPGDLVMNIMLAWNGSLGVSTINGITSPAYCVFRTRPEVQPRFLHYLLRTPLFTEVFKTVSTGVIESRLRLYPEVFFRLPSLLPSLPEQNAIVRYLDYMDRRIRRYINAKKKLIELLNEQKRAIIHNAVTRGLDHNVRLKPSGVEWLGDIPEHWDVASVKRQYTIQLGKMLQPTPKSRTDIAVPYLKAQHVQWFSAKMNDLPTMWASPVEIRQFGVREGDLLVCEGGEGGRCSLLSNIDTPVIIQNALHRVRPSASCHNEFLKYVLNAVSISGYFDALNNKATIAHFTREKFGALEIPIPLNHEQSAIIRFLDEATAGIDATIERFQREIGLLREYRIRLIADVVTGKVDAREAAANLPEEMEEESAAFGEAEALSDGGATAEDDEEVLTGAIDDN